MYLGTRRTSKKKSLFQFHVQIYNCFATDVIRMCVPGECVCVHAVCKFSHNTESVLICAAHSNPVMMSRYFYEKKNIYIFENLCVY